MSVLEKLNCKEEKVIEEFQMRMKNCSVPDTGEDERLLYYRFLKARDFDIDKAEKMLRKHLLWRRIWQIENILEDFKPSEYFMKYPLPSMIGFDKDGDIVRYSPAGTFNPHEIMKCVTMNNFMKHWFWFAEKTVSLITENSKKTGKKGYQCTMIFNADKLTFGAVTARVSAEMFLQFINAYQDNYPERMKAAFVINAPPYLEIIFSILKTVMSLAMLRKIHIIGRNGWKEKLLERIDADVLPAFLGGNRTDPDGNTLCKTFLNQGGRIPESYFLSSKDRYFRDASQIEKLVVPPSEKKEIQIEVNELGSLLQWEYFVKGKDIGFGLFLEESEYKEKEVIPIHKFDTHDGTVKDSHKCRSTGKYIIVFDNSYSWMSSKEIHYCITVARVKL